MATLTLKKKPLSKAKQRKVAWDWLEKNFVAFEQNLRPLAIGVSVEIAKKIKEDNEFPYARLRIREVINHYIQRQNAYKKALIESEYRYELDGTPVKRTLEDMEQSRYDSQK